MELDSHNLLPFKGNLFYLYSVNYNKFVSLTDVVSQSIVDLDAIFSLKQMSFV